MITYSEKLKDPRWQKKRLEILQRDNFTCQHCGDTKSTLHVHHNSYSGEPWEASDCELTTYCKDCHWFEEYIKDHYYGFRIIKSYKAPHFKTNEQLGVVVIGCDLYDPSLNRVLLFSVSKENPIFIIELQPFQISIMNSLCDLT